MFALIGLHEVRAEEAGTVIAKDYIMMSGAATHKGTRGCAYWASRDIPYATNGDKTLCFVPKQFTTTVVAEHDTLLVTVRARFFACNYAVAHVPRHGYTVEERTKWFKVLDERLAKHVDRLPSACVP